jgi:hypothetical protein
LAKLEDIEKQRPEALAEIRTAFAFLETTLLADGRDWILKTNKPSLADIEAVWPFHWLLDMKALPNLISAQQFPRVFTWIARFKQAVSSAKASVPKPMTIKGVEGIQQIMSSEFAEPEGRVDEEDPLGFEKGQDIEIWPLDSGFNNRDHGRLVALSALESVIEVQKEVGKIIRAHFPRHGYRLRRMKDGKHEKL